MVEGVEILLYHAVIQKDYDVLFFFSSHIITMSCCTSAVRSSWPFSILHHFTSAIRPPGSIDPLIILWGDNYTICKLPNGSIDARVTCRSPTLNSFRNKQHKYKKCKSIHFGLCMKCIIKMGELCRCSLQHCRVCVFFLYKRCLLFQRGVTWIQTEHRLRSQRWRRVPSFKKQLFKPKGSGRLIQKRIGVEYHLLSLFIY